MGTKMAVAFANIFMEKVESKILNQSAQKPRASWKRYIDNILPTQFTGQTNSHHHTIKFTAEVSHTETFLDTKENALHNSLD